MPRKLIITRAEPGARKTAERFSALGYDVACLPAIELVFFDASEFTVPDLQSVCIFTSANGVKAFEQAGWMPARKAICVGEATLKAARKAGFSDAVSAEGDVEAVLSFIVDAYSANTAPGFVHIANDAAVGALTDRLSALGYKARFLPLYGSQSVGWAEIAPRWHVEVTDDACIIIHSAKGAEAVASWIKAGGIATERFALTGLSERAIAPLDGHNFAAKAVAKQPNEHELTIALQTITQPGVS